MASFELTSILDNIVAINRKKKGGRSAKLIAGSANLTASD